MFNTQAQFAMSDWNAVTGSSFQFFVNSTGCDPSVHLPTSDNCVAFVRGSDIGGALGLTNFLTIFGALTNAEECVGEIANTAGAGPFGGL